MPVVIGGALLLALSAAAPPIDCEWFRKAILEEVGHWRAAVVTPSGFFQASLDREWQPVGRQTATLVSQSRLLYVLATGFELTRQPAYLEAVVKGADFLLEHFRDGEHGGWFYSVSPEGKVLDNGKDSYGHAFVIFGLAHAARITGEQRFRQAALDTWAQMKAKLRYESGFIKPRTTRDFSEVKGTNSQNPMMHLFEALLALHDVTGAEPVLADAQALAEAIFGKLYQKEEGYLPELFDENWKPLPADQRGLIELGHQFEWAFLLSRAVEKGLAERFLSIGDRLLRYGMRVGYDRQEGGIFSRSDYQGNVRPAPKGWWEQAELLRALAHYAVLRNRDDLWKPFAQSLAFVQRNFIDPEHGGWFRSYQPGVPRSVAEHNKGSVWMLGYHVTGMYWEVLRMAQCAVRQAPGNRR
jgi:mannose/cellobiose epimerase-like protein (N-acyl-D-glucosamine 2-epimerase family)